MAPNKTKIAIIVKILILIFLALTGYFVWGVFHKSIEPKFEQAFTLPANYDIKTPVFNPIKIEIPPFYQERQIYKPTSEATPLFFENIYETAKTVETKLKNEINAVTQGAPSASSSNEIIESRSNEIVLSLTNDEFHFLYPDSFIDSLVEAQNLFIKDADPSYEPFLKIETDSQVRLVEEKIVAALISINMLTQEEGDRAITTIRYTLPKLQLVELKTRKSLSLNQYFNFPLPAKSSPKKLFLSGLIEKLRSALAPKAQAAVCGYCYTLPECYQIGSSSPEPGYNVWKPFCYCTGCYYGQGCLDICSGGSAIFDPTTFICGCGY